MVKNYQGNFCLLLYQAVLCNYLSEVLLIKPLELNVFNIFNNAHLCKEKVD